MREIKFRVFDGTDFMSSPFTLQDLQLGKVQFTSDCPLMQYTGLKDKNGKEIYEGDIFKFTFAGNFTYIGKIVQSKLGWMESCVKDSGTDMGGYWPHTITECLSGCEVIGNIYENA